MQTQCRINLDHNVHGCVGFLGLECLDIGRTVWDSDLVLVGHWVDGEVLVLAYLGSMLDSSMVGSVPQNTRRAGCATCFFIIIVFPSSALAGECISHCNHTGFCFNITALCGTTGAECFFFDFGTF